MINMSKSSRHARRLAMISRLTEPIHQAVGAGRLSLRAAERLAAMSPQVIQAAAELIAAGQDARQVVAELCPREPPAPRVLKPSAAKLRDDLDIIVRVLTGEWFSELREYVRSKRGCQAAADDLDTAYHIAHGILRHAGTSARDLRTLIEPDQG